MIICHIDSGLGNQMYSYAEFLAYKKCNPKQKCYLEKIIYEIEQDAISMWNGFELTEVFNIDCPFVDELFTAEQWKNIVDYVSNSLFWKEGNWDYGSTIADAFHRQGINLINYCPKKKWNNATVKNKITVKEKMIIIAKKILGANYLRIRNQIWKYKLSNQHIEDIWTLSQSGDFLCGGFGKYMYRNSGMRFVEKEVRSAFKFSPIEDLRNLEIENEIKKTNSVSIHVRRGDMLEANAEFLKYGYYSKAVKYIKKRVDNPFFFIFCIPGDSIWCKDNISIFDLDTNKDKVVFVDWNTGKESYRDMQLMSECKHNIITRTSFGWWASYLNSNPNKITICPDYLFDTTVTIS